MSKHIEMDQDNLIYKWVPRGVRQLILSILAMIILSSNGIFLGTCTDIYNGRGTYAENYTMAYNAMQIGMGLGIMFSPRLQQRLTRKTLLLLGLTFLLFYLISCAGILRTLS